MRHVIQKCMFREKVGLESHRIRSSKQNDDQKNHICLIDIEKYYVFFFSLHGNGNAFVFGSA